MASPIYDRLVGDIDTLEEFIFIKFTLIVEADLPGPPRRKRTVSIFAAAKVPAPEVFSRDIEGKPKVVLGKPWEPVGEALLNIFDETPFVTTSSRPLLRFGLSISQQALKEEGALYSYIFDKLYFYRDSVALNVQKGYVSDPFIGTDFLPDILNLRDFDLFIAAVKDKADKLSQEHSLHIWSNEEILAPASPATRPPLEQMLSWSSRASRLIEQHLL
jgi:hypothetical protein